MRAVYWAALSFYTGDETRWPCGLGGRFVSPLRHGPVSDSTSHGHGADKAFQPPGHVRKETREVRAYYGSPGGMSKRGEELLEGEYSAIRSRDKKRWVACVRVATVSLTPNCDFLLFSHGHGSSRRFEGISPFFSSPPPRAHPLSKAQRQQGPAQDSYELNPSQQPTYSNNLAPGNNSGNGTSDNFYDEVYFPESSSPSPSSPKSRRSRKISSLRSRTSRD